MSNGRLVCFIFNHAFYKHLTSSNLFVRADTTLWNYIVGEELAWRWSFEVQIPEFSKFEEIRGGCCSQ